MSSLKTKLFKPKIVTAPSIGIDNRKDIFAESTLLNFSILAADIAIPDLLTPGINDKIWKIPINNADLYVKLFCILLEISFLSLIYNRIPNMIVVHPITLIFLNWSIKFNLIRT